MPCLKVIAKKEDAMWENLSKIVHLRRKVDKLKCEQRRITKCRCWIMDHLFEGEWKWRKNIKGNIILEWGTKHRKSINVRNITPNACASDNCFSFVSNVGCWFVGLFICWFVDLMSAANDGVGSVRFGATPFS